jgi:suppressor of G2 allele of SKP1
LTVKLPNGSDYSLELDPLSHKILPKESAFKILSTKIEIKLKKEMMGIMWGALEGEDQIVTSKCIIVYSDKHVDVKEKGLF